MEERLRLLYSLHRVLRWEELFPRDPQLHGAHRSTDEVDDAIGSSFAASSGAGASKGQDGGMDTDSEGSASDENGDVEIDFMERIRQWAAPQGLKRAVELAEECAMENHNLTTSRPPTCTRIEELFKPGHEFYGTIKIPVRGNEGEDDGTQFGERVRYSLVVVREFIDEAGKICRLVKHSAHGDEQVCILNIWDYSSGIANVSYVDYETKCIGSASVPEQRLYGTVHQLQYGEEGYRIPGNSSVHTFSLELCHSPVAGSVGYYEAKQACRLARIRYAVCLALRLLELNPTLTDVQTAADELVQGTDCFFDLCEIYAETNMMFLRYVDLLNGLVFESEDEKKLKLQDLATRGISRVDVQAAWDAVVRLKLALFFPVIRMCERNHDVHKIQKIKSFGETLRVRIHCCYSKFDNAMRAVEARIATNVLNSWTVQEPPAGTDLGTCCICMLGITGDESVLKTPSCSHMFHFICAKPWFHQHGTCPHCRTSLIANKV
eukprot:CAMPEP_0203801090 /NCGR_PEP_ID=MMETSP0100_2-20121128/11024_1 /ASSEMBLY_ACC=CAM_ASM_000210 /TAXON_ID=96639 /ORGANISM=" , Strain NY0313808BC1" /LENGTH=491 /DNA_ID=CAMNT_0050707535 /DNA_START=722 /DNA_END=2197 /DNA_ORIENTATION=+